MDDDISRSNQTSERATDPRRRPRRRGVSNKRRRWIGNSLEETNDSADAMASRLDEQRRRLAQFCRGMCPKSCDGSTIESRLAQLPRRQGETMRRLLLGDNEKEIARHLGISQNTVHVYIKQLYVRFNVASRSELLGKWMADQTPSPPPQS